MKYHTIVADPPWDHSDGTGWNPGIKDWRGHSGTGAPKATGLPYAVMRLDEIAGLPVDALADIDAHLYLWTTNRYLHDAYHLCEGWGFRVVKPLLWCKAPMGMMGGAFVSSAEYVLFARRGSLPTASRIPRQWFQWPRGAHSAKPEAFLDLVEQVSPGPYLELFARRQRLGWDTWGNECMDHVSAPRVRCG